MMLREGLSGRSRNGTFASRRVVNGVHYLGRHGRGRRLGRGGAYLLSLAFKITDSTRLLGQVDRWAGTEYGTKLCST